MIFVWFIFVQLLFASLTTSATNVATMRYTCPIHEKKRIEYLF